MSNSVNFKDSVIKGWNITLRLGCFIASELIAPFLIFLKVCVVILMDYKMSKLLIFLRFFLTRGQFLLLIDVCSLIERCLDIFLKRKGKVIFSNGERRNTL